MADNPKHVTVRLRVPPELRDKIAESANNHNRSMNADMVFRLESSFSQNDEFKKDNFDKLLLEFSQLFLELKNNQSEMIELKRKVDALEKKTPD